MSNDLISREDALRVFYNKEPLVQGEHDGMGMLAHALWRHIREAVEAIPAVESEPVVHARWLFDEDEDGNWSDKCSHCGEKIPDNKGYCCGLPRCPYCGAHMDEEVADGTR